MQEESYEAYASESATWLKRGRVELLRALLPPARPDQTLRILEVGAGVGQNVPALLERGEVDVLEIDPLGLEHLWRLDGIRAVLDRPIGTDLAETYDVVVAFDVLEHLEDDEAAVAWIAAHLAPGGRLIATVPAYQWLFTDHDVALEHFRRYTRGRLVGVVSSALHVTTAGYFVSLLFPLAAASRLAGKAVKAVRRRLGSQAASRAAKQSAAVPGPFDAVFRRILGLEVAAISRGLVPAFGLTVFCVAEKR